MSVVTVRLPWPPDELKSNSRAHWAQKHRATAKARYWAKTAAMEAKVGTCPNATLFIEYYPPSYRGDVQNVPSSLKAYIDGIADAMGCDDKGFKVDYPSVWAGKKPGGEVVFRIVPPVASVPLVGQVIGGRVVRNG